MQDGTAEARRSGVRDLEYLCTPQDPRVIRRNYQGEIDLFAVYCPETSGVYLVPIDHVQTQSSARLRVDPSRNNQYRYVRYAAQYEIGRVSAAAAERGVRVGGSESPARSPPPERLATEPRL